MLIAALILCAVFGIVFQERTRIDLDPTSALGFAAGIGTALMIIGICLLVYRQIDLIRADTRRG